MNSEKVIYMGTTVFSAYILEKLIAEKYNVVAVVSQPDRKVGRKQEIKSTPTKEIALKYGVEIIAFDDINDYVDKIKSFQPDLIITCAFGQKVSKEILDIPKYKCINVHASLLPKYRGGAPIHYAIMNGETTTGNTIIYMEEKLDSGDIISQSNVNIGFDDTTKNLHDTLMVDGANLLIKTLPMVLNDEVSSTKQDENLVTYSHNISRELEYIDFNRDIKVVYNHIRSLITHPSCYSFIDNKKIKYYKVRMKLENHNNPVGLIKIDSKEYFKVYGLGGYIEVYDFQLEGKKAVSFKDYLNGNKLEIVDNKIMNEGVKDENR